MRNAFLGAILVGLVGGLVVVAARSVTGGSETGTGATPAAEVTATPDPGSPRATAAAFAAALEIRDIAGLYDLLDEGSRFDRTLRDLEQVYGNFFEETTAVALDVEVSDATEAGATLDVTLSTGYFGDLEYSIALAFTREDDGRFKVAWTPSAVHPDLRDGRRFQSTVERPRRGAIYDRHGELLAHTMDLRYVGLNRALIDDREGVTARLVEFGFNRGDIDAAFDSPLPAHYRVPVGTVDESRMDDAYDLINETPGLLVYNVLQRVHPLGPAAAHVVGYTRELTAEELEGRSGHGYRPGDRIGASGLEFSMNVLLAGAPGGVLEIVDQRGEAILQVAETEFVDSQDVHTTLDANVLRAAHDALEEWQGAAAVIDPRTNEILAINSSPSFDPNAFERNDVDAISRILEMQGNPLSNRATGGLYSAGSTFKLITGAAGLMAGIVTPGQTIECGALWHGEDPPRRNWEGAQGQQTVAQALMRSCNPVFYEIAQRLYYQAEDGYLSHVARLFGLGSETGAAGLNEEAGLVPDYEWKPAARGEPWYPGDEVNLGIGQGDLQLTPLQLANAYTAFVNNRLRSTVILQGEEAEDRGEIGLTAAQHAHLMEGLRLVTASTGTAARAFSNAGYSGFAGKSGTAEEADEQQHGLFAAFYPADNPVAVAAVVLDDGVSGSLQAAPITRDILLAAAR